MENINRIKQLIERIDSPTLNNGMPLNEANPPQDTSFQEYWNAERNTAKNKLWDIVTKSQQASPDAYKGITKKHTDFLIDVFGTKFGPQMDPKVAMNILKNPDRFLGKINDYFSKTKNNTQPTGLKDFVTTVTQDSNKAITPRMLKIIFTDENKVRQVFLSKFKNFTEKRDIWRAKIDKTNLREKVVSYYISNPFTAVGKGRVLIDFQYFTSADEKILMKMAGNFDEVKNRKNIGIAEADGDQTDTNDNQPGLDVNAIKSELRDYLLIKSEADNNIIMNKRNVIPSNVILNPPQPTPPKPGPEPGPEPGPQPGPQPGPEPPQPGPEPGPEPPQPGPQPGPEPTPIDDIIEADDNLKRWFETPAFEFKDGELLSINAFSPGKNSPINKLFKIITKGDYYAKRIADSMHKQGFEVMGDKKDEIRLRPKTNNIKEFLNNATKVRMPNSSNPLAVAYAEKFKVSTVSFIRYTIKFGFIEKIEIFKDKMDAEYGNSSASNLADLLKNVTSNTGNNNIISII